MVRRFRRLLSCATLAAACVAAHAAELGDVRVASHIGQPLVADIELAMLDDAATPVGVRIADREVYGGAGIAVPPVLASLSLNVMRRDGLQFLHVTSLRPVDADHVHLYLELADKGQRTVRLATLWLTPDPNPAPAAVPMPVMAQAPVATRAAVPPAAAALAPAMPAALQRPARPGPGASPHAWPAPAATVDQAPARPPGPEAAKPAPAVPLARSLPSVLPSVLPLVTAHRHPAACTPSDDAQACTALGTKNADLRAQLGRLEDKVRVLQAKLGVTPASGNPEAAGVAKPGSAPAQPAARPAEAPAPAAEQGAEAAKPAAPADIRPPVPAKPKPIHSIKPLVPHKPRTPPADAGLPWAWIGAGAGVLALAGAATALVMARWRRSRNVDILDPPGVLDKLRRRFAARTQAPAPAAAAAAAAAAQAEPTLE